MRFFVQHCVGAPYFMVVGALLLVGSSNLSGSPFLGVPVLSRNPAAPPPPPTSICLRREQPPNPWAKLISMLSLDLSGSTPWGLRGISIFTHLHFFLLFGGNCILMVGRCDTKSDTKSYTKVIPDESDTRVIPE